jgi:hypothetical protein
MHISTTNIYNYSGKIDDDPTIIKFFNKLTSVEKEDRIPVYVVKEQIRCLLLAFYLLIYKNNNPGQTTPESIYYDNIKKLETYENITDFINNDVQPYLNGLNDKNDKNEKIKKQIDNALACIEILAKIEKNESSIVEQEYFTFVVPRKPKETTHVHQRIRNLVKSVHKHRDITRGHSWLSPFRIPYSDIAIVKKIFKHSTNLAFVYYTKNLLKDPRETYKENKEKVQALNKYYELKSLLGKEQGPYKKDAIDFLYNHTYCILLAPLHVGTQLVSFIPAILTLNPAQLGGFIASIVLSSAMSSGNIIAQTLGSTFAGILSLSALPMVFINTPNLYYSLGLTLYTLFIGLKPFMPQEGRAKHNPYMPKSDILNSAFYRPKRTALNLVKPTLRQTITDAASAVGTGVKKTATSLYKGLKAQGKRPANYLRNATDAIGLTKTRQNGRHVGGKRKTRQKQKQKKDAGKYKYIL